jgi:hypothetical protein
MAGRDISVTHEALGTVRVMRTGGCMGEVVGMAASLCRKHDVDPRAIYYDHLEELMELVDRGVGKPTPVPPSDLEEIGKNIAPLATLSTSGDRDATKYPATLLHDGRGAWHRNDLRWLSRAETPNWVELRWKELRTISSVRVLSGFNSGSTVIAPLSRFVFQYEDGGQWRDVPGAEAQDNHEVDWHQRFEPVTTAGVRLMVHETKDDISRIWEIEVYERLDLRSIR